MLVIKTSDAALVVLLYIIIVGCEVCFKLYNVEIASQKN
jgi:hypothetical protein